MILINNCLKEAHKKGIPNYKLKKWIYKKLRGRITIINRHEQGTSMPCLHCTAVLAKYELNITYMLDGKFVTQNAKDITDFKLTSNERRKFSLLHNIKID